MISAYFIHYICLLYSSIPVPRKFSREKCIKLLGEVRKNPCNIISKFLIVSTDTILRLLFFKNPNPPIHEHDNIEESIDTRGVKDPPISIDLARDFTTFERPPGRLNGAPPSES